MTSRNDWEAELHKFLFKDYNKDVHPTAANKKGAVKVLFDVQLIRILRVVGC